MNTHILFFILNNLKTDQIQTLKYKKRKLLSRYHSDFRPSNNSLTFDFDSVAKILEPGAAL